MDFRYPKLTSEFRLDNGFSVGYCRSYPGASASVRLCVRSGSADEDEFSGCGVSHFLEHMVFNGAGSRTKREMSELFSKLGAAINAYTFYDRTVYCVDCPPHSLEKALEALSDMMFSPAFEAESFKLERDVILREIDMCSDDLDDVLISSLNRAMFEVSPMRFPVIGERKLFESLSLGDLTSYHSRKYLPGNMMLIGVSDLPDADFLRMARRFFGGETCKGFLQAAPQPEPEQICPRSVSISGKTDIARGALSFRFANVGFREIAASEAWCFALAGGNSSRISRRLKYGSPLIDSIDYEIMRSRGEVVATFFFECAPGNAERALEAVKKEVLNFSVSRGEILKYKVNSLVAAANSTRNSSVLADSFLNLKYPSLDAPICKPYIDFLERLAPQEAADICARNFDENKSTSALLLPTSKVRRNKRASQAVKQEDEIVELSNGVRLILMPRRNFPKLHLRATALGGAQVLERRLRDIQGLAALSILRDTRRRNAAELADLIESRGISFNSSFGDATASVFVESLPDHWRTSAEILGDSLTCLRIDQKTFEAERRALAADISEDMDDFQTAAFEFLRREFCGRENPLSSNSDGDAAAVRKASAKDAGKILSSIFCARRTVLCACGTFDPPEVLDACESFFSKMGNPAKMREPKPCAFKCGSQVSKTVSLGDKVQSAIFAAMGCCGLSDPENYYPMCVLREILGGEDGIVFERVRERCGLAYSAGASWTANSNNGFLSLGAFANSGQMSEIEGIFIGIIQELSMGKIDRKKFDAAKTSLCARIDSAMQDPAAQAYSAASGLILRGSAENAGRIKSMVKSVGIGAVKRCASAAAKNPFIFKVI